MRGRVEVPDYTYHPFLKHLLFRMPAEESRRLTLGLLEYQSRTSIGRRIFRFFGHGLPPEKLNVDAFGIHFPGPIGLASDYGGRNIVETCAEGTVNNDLCPVKENGTIVGIVSIGDLVSALIGDKELEVEVLRDMARAH